MKPAQRTIATLAVAAVAGIALPLSTTVTANAAETSPAAAHQATPMAAAFSTALHQNASSVMQPQCDDPSCDMSDALAAAYEQSGGTQDAIAAAAANYGSQGGPSVAQSQAPAYTSPAQAAVAGAAGGAAGGAVTGAAACGAPGALSGAGVGALAGAISGAATAAANNYLSGATAGGKSITPNGNSDTAFD